MARGAAAAAAVIALTTGCGSDSKRVAPDSTLAEQCPTVPESARRQVVQARDGTRLGAATVGPERADVGVVIVYGRTQTLCDWLEEAAGLSGRTESQVVVVDRRGTASSDGALDADLEPADVRAAMAHLLATGSSEVVLVGSSLGTAAVAAASAGTPAPCAVVAISPAVRADGFAVAARGMPPLTVATETGNAGVLANAEALVAAARGTRGASVRELRIEGTDHSLGLLQRHAQVRDALDDAVRACQSGA